MKCLPSLILAGAQKSGTTALAAFLAMHPNISFASKKELHYFDRTDDYKKGIKFYLKNFNNWFYENPKEKNDFKQSINAESTPFYIASRYACKRIKDTIPNVRLIILLREPVARAYSEYQMKKR